MQDLLGALTLQDPSQKVLFLTNSQLLFKIKDCKQQSYWTILDTQGQIRSLPSGLSQAVKASSYSLSNGSHCLVFKNADHDVYLTKFNCRG